MNLVSLKDLSFSWSKNKPLLSDLNLELEQGQSLALHGDNGSGKTTLIKIVCGLLFAQEGTYVFKGEEISEQRLQNPKFNNQFRKSVGLLFQEARTSLLCPTVLEELCFGPAQLGLSKEEAIERAHELLEFLQIEKLASRDPYSLSTGEAKMVALAATLSANPELVCLDEPFAGLDAKSKARLSDLMWLLKERGLSLIIASHEDLETGMAELSLSL